MSIKKPALPDTPPPGGKPEARFEFDSRVKETLEVLTGRRSGTIKPLKPDATQADMIDKINEIISRLQ